MVKIKLSKSEIHTFKQIIELLISFDPESVQLGYSLAQEEINFNIKIKVNYNNKTRFYSIEDAISFTPDSNSIKSCLVNYLYRILHDGYYWL